MSTHVISPIYRFVQVDLTLNVLETDLYSQYGNRLDQGRTFQSNRKIGNDRLGGNQVGSQASRRVTRRLAWIQPVCISINAVPAQKGLSRFNFQSLTTDIGLFYVKQLHKSLRISLSICRFLL